MTLPRVQRPGSFHATLAEMIDAIGRRSVEADLNASAATISRWTDPDEANGRRIPAETLDLLCRLHPEAGRTVARHFAGLAGGVFLPVKFALPNDLARASADVARRAGELSAEIIEALSDDSEAGSRLSVGEARRVSGRIDKNIESLMRLKALVAARGGDR